MQIYHFAPVIVGLFRLWGRTLRFREYHSYVTLPREGEEKQSLIVALWHDELFPLVYLHRNNGFVAMISSSKDGEILARAMERLGYATVRGSSSRQGLKALLTAFKEVTNKGNHVILTVDGPRGPRHEAKAGAIFLASKAQVPILPVRVRMSRTKVFEKAWDRFQLPFPFARCEVTYGEPYMVPPTLKGASLLREQEHLTAVLEALV